jgi:hypothetical protein
MVYKTIRCSQPEGSPTVSGLWNSHEILSPGRRTSTDQPSRPGGGGRKKAPGHGAEALQRVAHPQLLDEAMVAVTVGELLNPNIKPTM